MDLLTEFIAVLLTGLAAILTAIGASAALRYRDPRLGLVAGALGLLSVVGALAFLHEVSPLYGAPFGVAPVPLGLAVAAVSLLYLALVRGHHPPPS
ncbi:MAG TPA: hypothetical protein VKT21_00455 [Thermoplasmata archaeon]|nr:hypothetical protein [Thermoplasmata archaeon]